ncbi:hypothetical protein Z945_334 [Sulfitobacter noctilucae]|uniref:hypothetical protein n=1 Tax=Sulfitobacter noctilucae TaxID=1342302 RepID=UPI0004693D07|nr:hypothetical protein [Sulfitobacter noctilucae]KIN65293.1 hypothetical protein Z945_334 [Sulfitobacter noctilucae]
MEEMLSKDVQAGLDAARIHRLRKQSRLRLEVNGRQIAVLGMWKTGFSVAVEDAPTLRGLVDLYDGATHLFQCLIVTAAQEADEMHYVFKRATPVATAAALDFERPTHAPVALIEQFG